MKGFLGAILLLLVQTSLFSYDDTPPCYHKIAVEFFRPDLVSQALSLYQVPQPLWQGINRDLQYRSRSVPALLRQRAHGMRPNPFEKPFNKKVAGDLLGNVLYEIFYSVVRSHRISNTKDIRRMFDFIYEQQRGKLEACFGEKIDELHTFE